MQTHLGTLEFSAPETLGGYSGYSEQIDVWCAGIVFYFMFRGISPFKGDK
jgi:serine/threonine protein kinase